ncbi:MAG TPA: type III-A CRISPR-associated protein Csm2 [Terriglobia bacterium]|nr:type III-A CRISPR-associated protein Csm2 [Terriglobia bacterium]
MNMRNAFDKAGIKTPPPAADSYFDDKGNLRLEYMAKTNVETLARTLERDRLSMHQLRRFFNYCREIERRLRSHQTSWEAERANVAKLSAFAADAAGKHKIPGSFREFIDKNVHRSRSADEFLKGFMQHFEALVGFSALYLKEEKR